MKNPERTIDLSETERFALYDPDYPEDLDSFVGDTVCVVGSDINHQNIWGDGNKHYASVYDSIVRRFADRYDGETFANRVFAKWLVLNGVDYRIVTLSAYRSITEVVIWDAHPDAESDIEPAVWTHIISGVQAWYSGYYATIQHERLVTYTAESGATIDQWETVTDDESVVTAFTESFDLETVREYFPYTITADI